MRKKDIRIFIEAMEEIGDNWTEEQVEEVYAYCNLHGLWKC